MDTPSKLYEYFEEALNYFLHGRPEISRKSICSDAGFSEQYLGQVINGVKKASVASQVKIAKAVGYSYEDFLSIGKKIAAYGSTELGARDLNALYERLRQIMKSFKLNEEELILKAEINTPKLQVWYFLGNPPDPGDIEKIAEATGYNLNWILKGTGPLLAKTKTTSLSKLNQTYQMHEDVIKRFKDPGWGLRMNSMLLEIEKNPDLKAYIEKSISMIADQIRSKKKQKSLKKV